MKEYKFSQCINDYPDFPKTGILFRDVLPILQDGNLFKELTKKLSKLDIVIKADAIIAIDARGFIFGTAIALFTGKPLITARKKGKLPGELISKSYNLEYGENTLCIQKEAVKNYNYFCIVDDLLATGGTASAVEEMLLDEGKLVTGLCVVVELSSLNGRSRMKCRVASEIKYD